MKTKHIGMCGLVVGAASFCLSSAGIAAGEATLGAACERQAKEAGITAEDALAMYIGDCVDDYKAARAQAPGAGDAEDDVKVKQGE